MRMRGLRGERADGPDCLRRFRALHVGLQSMTLACTRCGREDVQPADEEVKESGMVDVA
jgi:hypothetical protein